MTKDKKGNENTLNLSQAELSVLNKEFTVTGFFFFLSKFLGMLTGDFLLELFKIRNIRPPVEDGII